MCQFPPPAARFEFVIIPLVVQMVQAVSAAHQLPDAAHAEAVSVSAPAAFCQAAYRLLTRLVPHSTVIMSDSSGSVVAMPRAQPRPLSQLWQRRHSRATMSAVPIYTPSAPRAMALATS